MKAFLFDLDGTLADSLADLAAAINAALRQAGFPQHPVEACKAFIGDGITEALRRACPPGFRTAGTVRALRPAFEEAYGRACTVRTAAYAGAPEMVAALRSRGCKTAVVTNKDQALAQVIVGRLFNGMFDAVFGLREGCPRKPDPFLANKALQALGARPDEAALVGDSPVDMELACAAGLYPIGAAWGYRSEQSLLDAGARLILQSPEVLVAWLDSMR